MNFPTNIVGTISPQRQLVMSGAPTSAAPGMEEGETPAILLRLKQRIHLAVETWATSHIERLKWSLPRAIHRMA